MDKTTTYLDGVVLERIHDEEPKVRLLGHLVGAKHFVGPHDYAP